MTTRLLFVTGGSQSLPLVNRLNGDELSFGELGCQTFPDGEIYHRLDSCVEGRETVVVGTTSTPDHLLDLFDAANVLADEGALGITVVLPEIKPSRDKDRSFAVRLRQRMLAAVPQTPLGNRVIAAPEGTSPIRFYQSRAIESPRKARGQLAVHTVPVLFATRSYGYMHSRMLASGQFEEGRLRREPDRLPQLVTAVAGRDVIIVGGTIDHAETMDLYVLANRLYEAGALSLTMVVPYFGYSTMERKVKTGEAVKAKIRARLLSSVPRCPMGNSVMLVDLHSEGIPFYFEHGTRASHIYAVKRVILERTAAGIDDGRLASTDAGRSKWTESLAKDLGRGWKPAFAFKARISGSETRSLGALGDVAGRDIFLFDDMIRRGSTAIEAGRAYRAAGCGNILYVASHGVLPGDAPERLRAACDSQGKKLFCRIVLTDSHPRVLSLPADLFQVESIADILVENLLQKGHQHI